MFFSFLKLVYCVLPVAYPKRLSAFFEEFWSLVVLHKSKKYSSMTSIFYPENSSPVTPEDETTSPLARKEEISSPLAPKLEWL